MQSREIASVVAFLAREDASFVTGAEIMADGGLNLLSLARVRASLI